MPKKLKSNPSNAGLLALEAALKEWRKGEPERAKSLAAAEPPPADLVAACDGIAIEFALELSPDAEMALQEKIRALLAGPWELRDDSIKPADPQTSIQFRGLTALPPPAAVPSVGQAWNLARQLAALEGVRSATPLFAQLAPSRGVPDTAATLGMAADTGPVDPQARRDWHREVLGVPAAWKLLDDHGIGRGQGVVVAVVDTGYTDHPEVFERLTKIEGQPNRVRGVDLLDGDDPRDPLEGEPPLAFPSHGTSVTSVIVSPVGPPAGSAPGSDFVTGIAPEAQVLPIRMTTSVVLLLPNKLTPALHAAVEAGADVINISLGLPYPWPSLHAAIRYAVEHGLIIVAASGNYWPLVVYPAAYPEVLAAAACASDLRPWVWASAGDAVDVLAPGVAVQRAYTQRTARSTPVNYLVGPGTGTTFAAACCTGLAALWLSFHGGRQKLISYYGGNARRVPQAFHYLMRKTAKRFPGILPANQYGEGLPQAAALLQEKLPSEQDLAAYNQDLQLQLVETYTQDASPLYGFALGEAERAPDAIATGLQSLLGVEVAAPLFADLLQEVQFHIASRPELFSLLRDLLAGGRSDLLREHLLASQHLSQDLRVRLQAARPSSARAAPSPAAGLAAVKASRPQPPAPAHRLLRVYAFDPSLGASLSTAAYNRTTIDVRWEEVEEGPVGEYLEVVDIDPPTRRAYAPVNLNHPHILVSDGLEPSEGDPQFHQQMVYAVAMKTIEHFEKALGRPAFWATAPFKDARGQWQPEPFVRRLRVYPHALRARNAYYSPEKRALLFGYFRSPGLGGELAGPTVFTCLSYDIVAHETAHALLDGMYRRYIEGTNPDVLAFHEAFADVVALFQHFTHSDILGAVIEEVRGDLETDSLLGKLAKQFGEATGQRGALRDAIGEIGPDNKWSRRQPNPTLLQQEAYLTSVHRRGSILVAAIFDAFLQIYKRRTKSIIQLATGGSGVLPPGNIPSSLGAALAEEAAKTAGHVLNICIRALDYLGPLNINFGEYLRAIITADRDLVPNDPMGYRVAFAEAFRAWGISPKGITTVTPESLCWYGPEGAAASFILRVEMRDKLNRLLTNWRVTRDREALHTATVWAKRQFNWLLREESATTLGEEIGIDLARPFEVHTLYPTSSVGPDGETNPLIVVTLTQKKPDADQKRLRVGSTILFNLGDGCIRYIIHKRDKSNTGLEKLKQYEALRLAAAAESDPYASFAQRGEPFAALHLTGRF